MARPSTLTDAQKTIIDANINMFAADIGRLDGMQTVSKTVIRAYQKRTIEADTTTDADQLADMIERYIERHGLPVMYQDVIRYARYLRDVS